MKNALRGLALGFAMVTGLMVPATAGAQGCALCYTQAAGSGQRMIQALKSGILVLVFPPMGICIFITVLGYKKRNRFHLVGQQDKNAEEDRGPNSDLGW
jgi:hypothetical protein